jgi:hypothetical protein
VSRGTPVAGLIVLGSCFHFKAIEGAALSSDANLGEERSHFAVEAVLVHAQEIGGIAQSDEARNQGGAAVAHGGIGDCWFLVHGRVFRWRVLTDDTSSRNPQRKSVEVSGEFGEIPWYKFLYETIQKLRQRCTAAFCLCDNDS